jgi:hypothetical protein
MWGSGRNALAVNGRLPPTALRCQSHRTVGSLRKYREERQTMSTLPFLQDTLHAAAREANWMRPRAVAWFAAHLHQQRWDFPSEPTAA